MLRRLFTFLSLVSLLLFVATCVLWVRSYQVRERLRTVFDVQNNHGGIDENGTI